MNIRLIDLLRSAQSDWVSSEVLRQPTGVSRAAISKQIKALQTLGFEIESSPRKGYRLLRDPDGLQAELIKPFLEGTRFSLGTYVYNEVTESTNNDAKQLAEQGAPEGSIVFSEVQKTGRGRRGRVWFNRAGDCLQFSVLLRPPVSPQQATLIPLLAATSVYCALANLGLKNLGIKWPNDVLLGNRKFCGILCEMSVDMEGIQYAILGIGLNVNTPGEKFPKELMDIACSLASETGRQWRRSELMVAILKEMDKQLDLVWRGEIEPILQAWRDGAHTLGRTIRVEMPNGDILEGVAEDVTVEGALLVRDHSGQLHTLHSGEVSLGTTGSG